ncbi:MAG: hypothetical protein FD163_2312 [Hyphomonadaceae bacterium]|nr:MAG: hypothetical protein FD128_2112 [Hyphomonadaceae bacterium]KAF0183592.1 MAG: hypothetical protein FD163_2312 [Hyphomonadaceae bacterium]
MEKIKQRMSELYPGAAISIVLSIAATFIGARYGTPSMLIALLLGLAGHFLYESDKIKIGVNWSAREVLRFGIALLGFRIAFDDIMALGPIPIMIVLSAMAIVLLSGVWIAQALGQTKEFGALSAGSVAVCGVSAAMAIAPVLPKRENEDRDLAVTIVGVTTLSTVAMIVYPLLTHYLHLSDENAGILLGGTIHDVAQVAGAGFSISQKAGDTATFVKMVRVSALLPMVLVIHLWLGSKIKSEGGAKTQFFPKFLIAFFIFAIVNSFHLVPKSMVDGLTSISKTLLLISIAAIGVKTDLKKIVAVGWRPLLMVVLQTLVMLIVVLCGILFIL